MNWGELQRECHRLMDEVFENKAEAYKWLDKNFGKRHFSSLKYGRDNELLEEIYRQLYVKSIIN